MKPPPTSERTGILLMLGSIVLFAVNVLLLRAISLRTPSVDGYVASVVRGWVGLIIVVVVFRGRGFQPGRLGSRPMMMRGAAGAAGILLFYVTIAQLGAGRAVIINLTYPIFGALMAVVWLKEHLRAAQLAWMIAALGGLVVFFAGDALHAGFSRYELIGLLGAVVAGGAVVLIRLLGKSEHASTIYASQCVWSSVAALPVCAPTLLHVPASAYAWLVIASACVAGGQLALTQSFRTLSVARGSSIQMLLPIATALGGMAFFHERFTLSEVLGGALTLVATWQSVRPGRERIADSG